MKKRSKIVDEFEISTEIIKQEINKTKDILLVAKDGSIDIEEVSITGNIDEAKADVDMNAVVYTESQQIISNHDASEGNTNWNDRMQNYRNEKQVIYSTNMF